jgi:methyltransferase (TIGR00027 family)
MAQDPRNYDRGTIGRTNKNAYRCQTVIQIGLRNFLLCDMIRLLVDMVRCVTEIDAGTNGVPSNLLPSQTALTAAAARAAHLIVDHDPRIFADVLASALLGDQADELLGYHRAHGTHPVLSSARAQVVCRSRYTEDRLADSVRRGTTQYVILGAGLDSFAYRAGIAGRVRVFEVDHPATQQWKRRALSAARIPASDDVTFVPVDFETDSLAERLIEGGFDTSQPALVSWLGVTMYLTTAAIDQTLATVGGFAPGTEIVTDYMLPSGMRDETGESYASQVMAAAAERGEPWLTFLSPDDMSGLLTTHGFGRAEHVRQRDSIDAAMWNRSDSLRPIELSGLAHATITGHARSSI